MSMLGTAPIRTDIVSVLQAGMPAKIAELNAEFDDAYVLTAPHESAYLPALSPEDVESGSLQSRTIVVETGKGHPVGDVPGFGGHYEIAYVVRITFICSAPSASERVVYCERYLRAIKELVLPDHALSTGSASYEEEAPDDFDYAPQGGTPYRDTALILSVTTEETAA